MDKIKGDKNIKKKIFKGVLWALVVILYIPISLSYLSNQPLFQTFSARMATMILTDLTDYQLSINSIHISLLRGIEAGGLSVYDKHNNLMMKIGKLKAIPVYADWKLLGVMLHEVKLDSVDFRLGTYHENDTLNFLKFVDSFSSDTTPSSSNSVFKLKIKKLIVTNTHFELFNKSDTAGNGKAMDYSNMSFDGINMDIDHFKLYGDSLNFKLNNFSAKEKSGLNIKKLSSDFILSSTTITTNHLKTEMNNSNIDADIELHFRSWGAMSYFNDSVTLYGNFNPSMINLSDIGYFAEVMFPMKNAIKLKGVVKGKVNDLLCKNLWFEYGNDTRFSGDIHIRDITSFYKTDFQINFQEFSTSLNDVKSFKLPDSSSIPLPEYLSTNEKFNIQGNFSGNYFNFNTNLKINSGQSTLKTIVSLDYKENDTVAFTALLEGKVDSIGKYLDMKEVIGKSNFNISASGKGKNFDQVQVELSAALKNTAIMNYVYDSISYQGYLSPSTVKGNLTVIDPNLALFSHLDINFDKDPFYNVTADIRKAHLQPLKLSDNDFGFATKAKIKIKGNDIDKLFAHIRLDSTMLVFSDDIYHLKHIELDKYDSGYNQRIQINSDFIDLQANGNYKLSSLPHNTLILLDKYFPFGYKEKPDTVIDESLNLSVKIKDDKLLSEQFLGNTRIAPNSTLSAHLNFKKDSLSLLFNSQLIKNSEIRFTNNSLNVQSQADKLKANFASDFLILKDSTEADPSKIGMENFNVSTSITKNLVGFLIHWDNVSDTTSKNSGKIQGYFFKKDETASLVFDDVLVYTYDSVWTINKNNKIVFDTTGIHFENFIIQGGYSSLSVKGKVPKSNGDSLSVVFNNWDLGNMNPIIRNSGFSLSGLVNGEVETSRLDSNLAIISDIKIKDFGFNKVTFGDLRLMNTWDNVNESVFIKSQIIRKGNRGVGEIFSLEGFYYPFRDTNSLKLTTRFNRLNIAFLNPILKDLFHKIKGKAQGDFTLTGSLEEPVLIGKVKLERTSMVINYLNTKYSFTNYLTFNKDKINFNNIVIYDTLGNSGEVSGNITHKFFSDFSYDIHVKTKKLLFVNTNRRQNELYYGTAIASGDVHMWGDPNTLKLNIKTETAEGTNLSIPLDQVYSTSDNNYIQFVPPPVDSLTLKKEKEAFDKELQEPEMKYDISVDANVTPDAKVNIYLPADLGKIESRGHGNLSLKTSSDGEFSMIGDYIVDNGNFNFNFKNLISKRFDLVPGGKITWTGDPTGAYINIKGLYKVKASLSSLGIVVDSTAEYKNKQTVNCYIILKNKLLNPDIKFAIELPDADPDIRRMVYTNLDTTNPAMVNEQMISLLVFGSFSFNNATNFSVAGQGYNILTNQLSSMLSKLSNNFDIGMNYRPGDDISQQEFEFALSTQLFNDRLIIDGNVGMTYDRAQKNASNIVGDVDILYKLTKDGRWLLKAFNHSNANSWYYYNNYDKVSPYTQGVGIAYRKDFNNIAELFRGKKSKKKKAKKEDSDKNL